VNDEPGGQPVGEQHEPNERDGQGCIALRHAGRLAVRRVNEP
jgi:hypothetical protein